MAETKSLLRLCAVLASLAGPAAAQSPVLWTNRLGLIEQRDAATFDLIQAPSPWLADNYIDLAFDGDRLWTLAGINNQQMMLYARNPADGIATLAGPLGVTIGNAAHGLDVDPQSGDLWATDGSDFFSLDKSTGSASLRGVLSGLPPWDAVGAIAIASPACVYATGTTTLNPPRVRLYQLDLNSFGVSPIGTVQLPYYGPVVDLALMPSGDLLAALWRGGTSFQLFRIDVQTAIATPVGYGGQNPLVGGLAIGPGTTMVNYCTAKTNSAGCAPSVSALGFASIAASSGFIVSARDVRNQTSGALFWTTRGPAALPFGGGTLCLASPISRTLPSLSGGSAPPAVDCSGTWMLDLNAHLQTLVPFPPGTTISCQWFGRDPGFVAPNALQLSNALEYTLEP